MVGIRSIIGLLKGLGLASWRDVQSFRSIAGQNLFLFLAFVALQPESAQFFGLILFVVVLFPLSADPMQKIPAERRAIWPILGWEWGVVRIASFALSPILWIAILILACADWRTGFLVLGAGALLQLLTHFAKRSSINLPGIWFHWIPTPPGMTGAIMHLQWREMLRTLDPYVALVFVACTELYRASGKPLDPTAPRIMSLIAALAMSTETQVLFGIDGTGAERYRQLPIRGWQILLAKDLAFLAMLGVLVLALDFVSGIVSGIVALAIGHHRSVLKPVPQIPWRFTSGALVPDGVIQIVALFAAGNAAKSEGLPLIGFCILAWCLSLVFYGRQWDRRKLAN